jgi:hypothetical protein
MDDAVSRLNEVIERVTILSTERFVPQGSSELETVQQRGPSVSEAIEGRVAWQKKRKRMQLALVASSFDECPEFLRCSS